MLAVVDQQQRLSGPQNVGKSLPRGRPGAATPSAAATARAPVPDRPAGPDRPRRRHPRSDGDRGGDCQGQPGLTDPAGSGQGQQRHRLVEQPCARRLPLLLPADEAGPRDRRRARQRGRGRGNHGRPSATTRPRNVSQVCRRTMVGVNGAEKCDVLWLYRRWRRRRFVREKSFITGQLERSRPGEPVACDNGPMRYPLRFHVLLLPNVSWPELKARVRGWRRWVSSAPRWPITSSTGPTRPRPGSRRGRRSPPLPTPPPIRLDRRHADPAAQSGHAGPPGAHPRSHLAADGSNSDWARGSRSIRRTRWPACRTGSRGARRPLRGVRRSGGATAGAGGHDLRRAAIIRSKAR